MMCVQRLPRYELLLSELVSVTEKSHSDFQQVQVALISIKQITSMINRNKQENQTNQRVEQLQRKSRSKSKYGIPVGGILIKEGPLIHLNFETGKGEKLDCFLFNDLLLCSKSASARKGLFDSTIKHDFNFQIELESDFSIEDLTKEEIKQMKIDPTLAQDTCFKIVPNQKIIPVEAPSYWKVEKAIDKPNWTKILKETILKI